MASNKPKPRSFYGENSDSTIFLKTYPYVYPYNINTDTKDEKNNSIIV